MSYLLFIGGVRFEVESNKLSQTKQVNDISRLSDRQTNYTNKFKAYKTANNVRAFDNLDLPGSNSNFPYQKNECYLFDADTGECLIYKGWANIVDSSDNEYDIYIYDGIVDFYKEIENRKISEIGISDLNHLKNIEGVINSWDEENNLPYRYMLADYGGKVFTNAPDNFINIDYLVPSAFVKFIWDRVFSFFGFTYSGSIFNTEKFTNFLITFPKPVGSEEQEKVQIITFNYQDPLTYTGTIPSEFGGIFYVTYYESSLLKTCFSEPAAYSNSSPDTSCRTFSVVLPGLYQFKFSGNLVYPNSTGNYGILMSRFNTITNQLTYEKVIDNVNGLTNFDLVFPFNASPEERIGLHVSNGNQPIVLSSQFGSNPVTGNLDIELSQILGNVVNFENAFIDFPVKDFINEVLNHFGLTPFKDRFSRNIEFLTLSERLQTTEVLNWSSKFPKKLNTKYSLNNYAQKNIFRYKYNDEQANYNDGSFEINDKTLDDEVVVFNSRIFTIEKGKTLIAGKALNIYPIWRKEVKDNGEVQYKELENRFYFIRCEKVSNQSMYTIGSDVFAQNEVPEFLWIESYYRLRMQEVINDNWRSFASLVDQSKIKLFEFNLSSREVANFNFKPLIYLEQWGSYYIVNRIINAQKNVPVKCELIEVDYFTEFEDAPVVNNGTYIEITDSSIDGCSVTIYFDTDAELPTGVRVVGTKGLIFPESFDQTFTPGTNSISFSLPSGGTWSIRLFLSVFGTQIFSQPITIDNALVCTPETPEGTFITINSFETISVSNNNRTVRLYFSTDIPVPNTFQVIAYYPVGGSLNSIMINVSSQGEVILPHRNVSNVLMVWNIQMQFGTIFSNIITSES